ncbi:membrane alanyl aminopeptidase-like [Plodia interpunctella]|uniref:membrane alanyl aminopeptidase-like n=1 Tax=Plodia interpunctella TaxID=58824 RepID=UPI002368C779|nr:membrane alanyl aminopeptidase-like [Plodia interpunctella]
MERSMSVPVFLFILLGSAFAIPDELRSSFEFLDRSTNLDDPKYRLKDYVQPTDVYVDLDVYLDEGRFNGLVQLTVQVQAENLTQIVLHQNVVSIETVTVLNANNQPVPLRFPNPYITDSYYEILEINFENPLPVGQYDIVIRYLGRINENPVDRGFYRGYYYVGNEIHTYATTQFQPYHARKAFPCFDEPQFKSRFVISITRDGNLSPSYSNMAINDTVNLTGGRVRETFLPTPIISAYLIAFHVSDFVETTLTSTPTKPFGIISRQGVTDQHAYAADIGLKITNELDDYLGIDYYDMGQGQPMKNDHIALPDFPSGAMENWGMVNYREAYLLYDENNTNINNKITIATIMAHELAHKWFGNLVTCFWWSNLWLNESFASFFEYFGAHWADPELELDDQFVIDYVHSALNSDASASATPMNLSSVADNNSISNHFSTTSYAKGASVLKMLEHFLGFRTFRQALRYYLRDNAYGLGTPEAMYAAFRRAASEDLDFERRYPNIDIGEVFDSWVQNPGAPVLNVDFNMNTGVITITQQRYQLTGSPPAQLWQIPISWAQRGSGDFTNTKPSLVLTSNSTTIQAETGHNFVLFNIKQSGLYRVNYDDHNWEMIASFLRNNNNRVTVDKLNRAQIVNDVLYFLRSEHISTERAFDVLSFLEFETDYYVWGAAIGQLDWIRRRLEHLTIVHDRFNAWLLQLLNNVVNDLGFDGCPTCSTSRNLNRIQILNLACNLGHERCISDSLEKWNAYKANDTNLIDVNIRRHVYCVGLRHGDNSDYDFLFSKYNSSENTADMVVILRALACTNDTNSLLHYLDQSMHNDKIRIHDKTNAFSFALQGNRNNLNTVLQFLFYNYAEIRTSYGGAARLNIAINSVAAFLTNFSDIQRFQNWAYVQQLGLGSSFNSAVGVVNLAISNLQWGNNAAAEIMEEVLERSSSAAITSSILLMLAAFVAHMLR